MVTHGATLTSASFAFAFACSSSLVGFLAHTRFLIVISIKKGWVMWMLTHYGEPEPWTKEEVHVYLAKVREELKNV
jgi:hypothetical protein